MTYIRRVLEIHNWMHANTTLTEHEIDSMQLIETMFAGGPFLKGCTLLHKCGILQ